MRGMRVAVSVATLALVGLSGLPSAGPSAAETAPTGTQLRATGASAGPGSADVGRNGKIAFIRNRKGAVDVFVVNPSGMTPVNLTRSRADELYVDWSPNGRHVVFTRFGKGAGNLFRISRRGTGLLRLTTGRASDEVPLWSPDGAAIAFDRTRDDAQ